MRKASIYSLIFNPGCAKGLWGIKGVYNVEGETQNELTELKVSVIDTGIGIPDEQLGTIFDRFKQVDGTRSRKYEGTGLGLSIAKKLIDLMKGDVSVTSTLGQGTQFDVRLPLPHCKSAPNSNHVMRSLAGRNILIVATNSYKREGLIAKSVF